mgnify:CR=1 FL=1
MNFTWWGRTCVRWGWRTWVWWWRRTLNVWWWRRTLNVSHIWQFLLNTTQREPRDYNFEKWLWRAKNGRRVTRAFFLIFKLCKLRKNGNNHSLINHVSSARTNVYLSLNDKTTEQLSCFEEYFIIPIILGYFSTLNWNLLSVFREHIRFSSNHAKYLESHRNNVLPNRKLFSKYSINLSRFFFPR